MRIRTARDQLPDRTAVAGPLPIRRDPIGCAYLGGVRFDNRVTRLLGIDIPIFQAPMGFVAKPPLVAAVSEAGAMGLVPGSLGTDIVRDDIRRTRS